MSRQEKPLSEHLVELLAREHLLTAPKIVELLKAAGMRYNKTSVYRTLDKLVEQELVCKLNFGDNEISYELQAGHHDHLVCTSCGTITACQCEVLPKKEIDGFRIDHHHATYFGTCAHCRAQAHQS